MPLDAICLHAVLEELKPQVIGAKIDKVQQPDKDKILLSLRGKGFSGKLLLVANTGNARMHLTEESYENPQKPPMFCMLLRKHLAGGRIQGIQQVPYERIVRMQIESYDEFGQLQEKELILELLGSQCNLILLNSDGMILEALRRVDYDPKRQRAITPGLNYHLPKAQEKESPLTMGQIKPDTHENSVDQWIMQNYKGISPLVARELSYRIESENRAAAAVLSDFARQIQAQEFTPYLLEKEGSFFDFSYFPILQYGETVKSVAYANFSNLLDAFYKMRNQTEKRRQQAGDLTKTITNLVEKVGRKLETQQKEQIDSQKREIYREKGDLITANLYKLKGGESVLQAENFYDPEGGIVEITLDVRKNPQQNAAAYYKQYSKRKTAERHLEIQIEKARAEHLYLESVLEAIEKSETAGDVAAIRTELVQSGYLRKTAEKKQKELPSAPMEFLSSSGFRIFAGKNNLQNDVLTFRQAHKADIWLHTQKIHGSHVIISSAGTIVDENTMQEAAMIAAYYSKGKDGSNVPVDYTAVKFVKKPAGAKAGAAHYTNQQTLYVTPDITRIEAMRKK